MKKYFKNNRVISLLLGIIILSVIVIIVFSLKYFYFGNGQTNYGDRLGGIKEVTINAERKKTLVTKFESDKLVKKSTLDVVGKIIYIVVDFETKASLIEAQSKAVAMLEEFSEKEEAFYDFHFTLKQVASSGNDGFVISGAKNVKGTNLVWNNNRVPVEEPKAEGKEE